MGAAATDLEARVAQRLDVGDHAAAATMAIRALGAQILGYIGAVLRNDTDAADVFSMFCEDLWKGMPEFRRESSFKTWAYRVAWHAAMRFLRDPHRRRGRALLTNEAENLAVEVRTATAVHVKTQSKDALAEMRAALDPEEQSLLVLRIDRGLGWSDIAEVLGEERGARAEAALRKRFERLKDRLRREAIGRGLLTE